MRDQVENAKAGWKLIQDEMDKFRGGPLPYTMDVLLAAHDLLLERFAPYKVGDRVELAGDVDVSKSPGWASSAHFLKRGAKATVEAVRVRESKKFGFDVIFDEETWVDNGVPKPVSSKHTYSFGESALRMQAKLIECEGVK